jgi:hypothetical protein
VLEGLYGAGFDHPVLPAFPEGDYLKFATGRVLRENVRRMGETRDSLQHGRPARSPARPKAK